MIKKYNDNSQYRIHQKYDFIVYTIHHMFAKDNSIKSFNFMYKALKLFLSYENELHWHGWVSQSLNNFA